jgi:predicted dehydrogenase
MTQPVRIAVIGCGNISDIYFKNLATFEGVRVVACADLDLARAQATASRYNLARAGSLEDTLGDPEVDLVLNLTTPDAHASVGLAALEAGKHVYNEKPLALALEDANRMLELAQTRGLRIGCAPDTFLGGGLQTCRRLIEEGAIGVPVAASAFMTCPGHESWHPNPAFYYQPGAGPMFDMGPYYLTALVSLLGPVRRVTGQTRASFPERTITSQPRNGEKITVNTPTHVTGLMEFEQGAQGTIITSFDVWAAKLPFLEIYGSEGSLSLPDPNTFGGPVRLFTKEEKVWKDILLTHAFTENSRGLGVADMAQAIRTNRPHRASGELARHVLEVMHGFLASSDQGRHIEIQSRPSIPAPLREGSDEPHLIGAS